jgi:DNA-binding PadR family transcriptional regulator
MIGHGYKLVDKAEKEGYIRREWREPEGKGAWLRINHITQKGKNLLQQLGQSAN